MPEELVTDRARPTPEELDAVSAHLESLPPREAADETLRWSLERFGDDLVVASSFQDVVLVHLVERARPGLEIVFLDTGYHFPETLAFVEHVRKLFDLNLTVTRPSVALDDVPCGTDGCCQVRKVEPLARAIAGRRAWVTGLKRVDTPERAAAPYLAWDRARPVVKVNPLAAWTDEDIDTYLSEQGLPFHPLRYVGYLSIGCAPTTRPIEAGANPRDGRWPGSGKTECGLHL